MLGKNAAAIGFKEEGNAYFRSGKFDLALHCYNQGIMLDPDIPELWYNKGMAHKRVNEPFLAKKAYDRALTLRPDYAKALTEKDDLKFKKVVIFYVADLTLDETGQVKILEFGNGFRSGLSGYDSLVEEDGSIQRLLKRLLRSKYGNAHVLFNSGFGNPVPDNSKLGRWVANVQKAMPDAPVKGIYGGFSTRQVPEGILALNCDARLGLLGQDKEISHRQFDPSIAQYRPVTTIVSAPYHAGSIGEVQSVIKAAEHCVVKRPDGSNGLAVEIIPSGKLDKLLKQLLGHMGPEEIRQAGEEAAIAAKRRGKTGADLVAELQRFEEKFLAMHSSSSSVVLVEQFSPSKALRVEGKDYRPTIRAVFVVEIEGEKSEFMPVAAYWKLPKTPMGEGPLEETYISKVDPGRVSTALVSTEDNELVFRQLEACIPTVMRNTLSFDVHLYALELIKAEGEEPTRKAKRKHGIYLLNHYANSLGGIGEIDRAFEVLEIIGAYGKGLEYYRERGVIYQDAGKYDEALREFEEALKFNPDDSAIKRRIAVVRCLKAGDFAGAVEARARTVFRPQIDPAELIRAGGVARGGAGGASAGPSR